VKFEHVLVVGAGQMGGGIAQVIAASGRRVSLHDPFPGAVERGLEAMRKSLTKLGADVEETLARVEPVEDLVAADLLIEAIVEDPRVKGKLFAQLDQQLPDAHFLASNTSSIPIAEVAAWTQRPERVVGLHFFSPVPVMKLVEVVVALDTSERTVQTAHEFAEAIGKQPIQTKDRSGFIVNMLLVPYLMAAVRMFEDGFANREDIDEGMRLGCGHPMGPLTLCDFIGLDVLYAVCDSLYDEFKRPEYAPPPLLKRMVVSGHHGRKAGRGFYEYEQSPG
jgi:3-hydroxybutyryl-CoA dehydrogenase